MKKMVIVSCLALVAGCSASPSDPGNTGVSSALPNAAEPQLSPSSAPPFSPECGEGLNVYALLQDRGNTYSARGNQWIGTVNESRRLEAFEVQLVPQIPDLVVKYQVHVEDYGTMSPVEAPGYAGTWGRGKRVEAVKMWLEGPAADQYDINYRCWVQDRGEVDGASNGLWCWYGLPTYDNNAVGGSRKRIEALAVTVTRKENTSYCLGGIQR